MQSDKIEILAVALGKLQSTLKGATPTGSNPAFKRDGAALKYVTLDDVWDAVRASLGANELSVAQGVDQGAEGKPFLWTLLMHSSGQWLRSEMPLILGKQDPQGVGAAMTYYRRYSLAAMLGVTQEDDDANSAQPQRQENRSAPPKAAPQANTPAQTPAQGNPPPVSDTKKQVDDLIAEMKRSANVDVLEAVSAKIRPLQNSFAAPDVLRLQKTYRFMRANLNGGKP